MSTFLLIPLLCFTLGILVKILWFSPHAAGFCWEEKVKFGDVCAVFLISVCYLWSQRLQAKVLKLVDISYGGENGFNQAIELSAEVLSNVKFIQEKKLIGESTHHTMMVKSHKSCCGAETNLMIAFRAVLWWDQPGYGEVLFWCGWHTQSLGDGSGGDPHSLRELRHHALYFTCARGREQRSRERY